MESRNIKRKAIGKQKVESGKQKAESGKQKAESGKQKAESRKQKAGRSTIRINNYWLRDKGCRGRFHICPPDIGTTAVKEL